MQGNDQVQGYKDCPNCLISASSMVGDEEKICFLDALKHSVLAPILPKKALKRIKPVFFKIWIATCISERLNLGVQIIMPNSALHYENLPVLVSENIKCMDILKLFIKKLCPSFKVGV